MPLPWVNVLRGKEDAVKQLVFARECDTCHRLVGPLGCLACYRQRRKAVTCPGCKGPKHASRAFCNECRRRLKAAFALLRKEEKRPEGFAFPPGHIEKLAARAEAGLPLFGE